MTPAIMPCETMLRQRRARKGNQSEYVGISGKEIQLFDLGKWHEDERKGRDLRYMWEVVTHD